MKMITKSLLCAALLAASTMGAAALPGAQMAQPATSGAQQANDIEQVQYRNRGRYYGGRNGGNGRYGYRRNNGRNIGIGIGAAIIGGIILNEAARAEHRSSNGDQWERCASTYRSFEPSTGMYTGYDGARHTCPYLN
jgi:opacity protein-like surface antigen